MRIHSDTDLLPNLQKYLPLIPEERLFHKAYGLKHPSAIYNTSFGKIEEAVRDFFHFYDSVVAQGFETREKDELPSMMKSYRHLLYALREHLDDSLHIAKAFIAPPANERPERNQYLWLQFNAGNLVEDFYSEIADYKKYLDLSVNELKHNNAVFGGITFFETDSNATHCSGYFIANVNDDCYEPVEKIHARFHGTHTGFSFRRDLAYNIYNVYAVAEHLSMLLTEKLGLDLSTLSPKVVEAPQNRRDLFQKVMDMPRIHLPDEYLKQVPSVSLTNDGKLKLEYPSQLTIHPNRLRRIVLRHTGDGHTRTFRMLYAGGSNP